MPSVSDIQRCAVARTVFTVAVKRIKPDLTFVYISTELILFCPLNWLSDYVPCLHSFISLSLLGYVFLGTYVLDIFAFSI